ncbi:MAG: acylphosphatase [Methylococcales bacterium]
MIKRVNLTIRGHVQGVFFRAATREQAQRLGLTGLVRNLNNGNVNAIAQGESENIEHFISWCKLGPSAARVEEVFVKNEPVAESETSFSIIS